jgi:hypothetical protein
VVTAPRQQLGEERARPRLAQVELLVRSDDAGLLGVMLDAVDVADQIERFLGFGMLLSKILGVPRRRQHAERSA